MSNERTASVQDVFLNHLRKSRQSVTIFLSNGVKLQGKLTWFDNFCLCLSRDGITQLVYKHSISTVMPGDAFQISDLLGVDNEGNLDDIHPDDTYGNE